MSLARLKSHYYGDDQLLTKVMHQRKINKLNILTCSNGGVVLLQAFQFSDWRDFFPGKDMQLMLGMQGFEAVKSRFPNLICAVLTTFLLLQLPKDLNDPFI